MSPTGELDKSCPPVIVSIVMGSRFWEIDILRTVAIVMMVSFHAVYVPYYLGIAGTGDFSRGAFWWWISMVTPALFIFLAGLSLPISQTRAKTVSSFVRRGLKILGLGMAITFLTWLVSPDGYVRFGILHFFGLAFMIGHFFVRFRFLNLALGLALLAIGFVYLRGTSFDFPWLLWLGLRPQGVSMMDYVPMVPWFGFLLVGIFCGKMLYPEGTRVFGIREFDGPVTRLLTLPGKHPLELYVAQWPVILVTLFIMYPDRLIPYLPF